MGKFYCEQGIYSASPGNGSPRDGDGRAKGAGSCASASVTFSGVPGTGDVITINGVTYGITGSGATVIFTAGADTTAAATNLAAAINGATATGGSWNPAGAQQRDLFHAT